ncbi:MAG: 3'-5' exonuclease [Sandaracinaceae bacterium]|nr:3'-5' exonuclease [Sandaracinaceae bacterium]
MIYLSIDVEASGPFPGLYYLASVGAVPVRRGAEGWHVDEASSFYVEIAPLEGASEMAEAMAVHGLTRAHLEEHGKAPEVAMRELAGYLRALGPLKSAAWPSSFDHGYVGWYLQRFTGDNPLGHSGFDIGSYAMGLFRSTGRNAMFRAMEQAGWRPPENPHPHHALHDAIEQGQLLAWLLTHAERLGSGSGPL